MIFPKASGRQETNQIKIVSVRKKRNIFSKSFATLTGEWNVQTKSIEMIISTLTGGPLTQSKLLLESCVTHSKNSNKIRIDRREMEEKNELGGGALTTSIERMREEN